MTMKRLVSGVAVLGIAFAATACSAQTAADSASVVRIGEMSIPRAAHQATRLPSGKVLVTGGCTGQCDATLDTAELFDPATGRFEPLPTLAVARNSHAAVVLPDGRVLLAGGWSGQQVTGSVELFDPGSGRFSTIAAMAVARAVPVAAVLADGRVLVTGGQSTQMEPFDSAELFDPATGHFSVVGSMQSARLAHTAVALADGRILIVGGIKARRGEVLRSAEIFDPATGRFTPTGEMAFPRHKHAAVRLTDGRVLVIGGSGAGARDQRYRSTEIYDPATGGFSPGPDMQSQRYKLPDGAVMLRSGDVLVAAGAAQVERFDAATQRFMLVPGELDGPQEFASATLLDDGDVLVLGGYDEQIQTSASAWLVRLDPGPSRP